MGKLLSGHLVVVEHQAECALADLDFLALVLFGSRFLLQLLGQFVIRLLQTVNQRYSGS